MASKRSTGDIFLDHLEVPETLGGIYRNGIETHISVAKKRGLQLIADEKVIRECMKQIDIILVVLDRIASCGFGCQGGDHLHEQLICKFCNHSNSVRILGESGLNDQAYACYRSMAEILNLITLFWCSTNDLTEFRQIDKKERTKKFSPAKVRTRLKSTGVLSTISSDEYGKLSGIGVHPDVSVNPNCHNPFGVGYAIPKHQTFAFWDLNY